MNIYVGNLPRQSTEEDVRQAFSQFGAVSTVSLIKDKMTGESRGFGFVEMASKEEAQAAMNGLNGKDFQGRTLTVNEARPKTENSGRRGGFGGGSGGGYGGGSRGPRREQRW